MTAPRIVDGWLVVPYTGDEYLPGHLGVSDTTEPPTDWAPAFLDWHDGQRVAKIRLPVLLSDRPTVWHRTRSGATSLGRFART